MAERETYREASRQDFMTGLFSPLGNTKEALLSQIQIGAQQRLADASERVAAAMERQADWLEGKYQQLTTVCIDPYRALDFRDVVEEFDGAFSPLAIVGWQFTNVSSLSVTVSFEDAGVLFALGARWNWEIEREQARQQEGGVADE